MNRATVRVNCGSPEAARTAGEALAPDHDGQVLWRTDGADLVLDIASATTLGLVRTLDDALGCLRATGLA